MNSTKKSEPKQSVIAAISTFPCPVTVPEILHQLDREGQSKLTRPEGLLGRLLGLEDIHST